MLGSAISRSLAQIPDPAFRRVLLLGIALTTLLYVVLVALAWWPISTIDVIETGFWDWLDDVLKAASFLVFMIVLYILFLPLATMMVSFFLDDIAAAVEQRHYPDDAAGQPANVGVTLGLSLRFLFTMILANLVALPFYLIFLIFPPLNVILFYVLNGYLLSREYFELVASRHAPPREVRRLRKARSGVVFLSGVVTAFGMTIPVVNFAVPVLATAMTVHLFKGIAAGAAPDPGGGG